MTVALIRIYGAIWCPDTSRARRILERHRVPYNWHDTDADKSARAYVESVNQGECRIPTIVFNDGSILVEPGDEELENKLSRSE